MPTEVTITGLDEYAAKVVEVAGDTSVEFAGGVRDNLRQLSPFGIGTLSESWKVTGPLIQAAVMSVQVSTEEEYAEYQDSQELRHMPQRGLNDSGQRSFAEWDKSKAPNLVTTDMAKYSRGYYHAITRGLVGGEFRLGYIDKAVESAGGARGLIAMIEAAIGGIK